ncbi:MAG: hypothetical protein RL292_559 [Candidatus Parcubacteria bacterium]|jgi:DNA helicase-2/ATP-dependent DNA helicase PcrA
MEIVLDEERKKILSTTGHTLIIGGPGSGKTTIALLRAHKEINSNTLKPYQKVLFLSFARATVTRINEVVGKMLSKTEQKQLQIETYHGFAWNLVRSHGYLLKDTKIIRLLPPPEAASHLASFLEEDRDKEKIRLFEEEGLLHFDLFAKKATEILSRSNVICKIVSNTYPLIILDEFQDTNPDEWSMIQELGRNSTLISLADAEQRIYNFRGADPKRIGDFMSLFSPTTFDFGSQNNRSTGKDITLFGNDLLTGANISKNYIDVEVIRYPNGRKGQGSVSSILKVEVIKGIASLVSSGKLEWSLVILVPTKKLMLEVSDYLNSEQRFKSGRRLIPIYHEVAVDAYGPSLAATLLARLLEGEGGTGSLGQKIAGDLCAHIRGRNGGERITASDQEILSSLNEYISSGICGKRNKALIQECIKIPELRKAVVLSGDPEEDWLTMRRIIISLKSKAFLKVEEDANYLRLLHKGATLRSLLSESWKKNGNYSKAASLVQNALMHEHFSASTKKWKGVQVMTIHKSKGKEFDEVLIYEGLHTGRIVTHGSSQEEIDQKRLVLRVGVTRGINKVKIFTPESDPCILL